MGDEVWRYWPDVLGQRRPQGSSLDRARAEADAERTEAARIHAESKAHLRREMYRVNGLPPPSEPTPVVPVIVAPRQLPKIRKIRRRNPDGTLASD